MKNNIHGFLSINYARFFGEKIKIHPEFKESKIGDKFTLTLVGTVVSTDVNCENMSIDKIELSFDELKSICLIDV